MFCPIQSWKKRWFVLRKDSLLYYYKDEKEVGALGIIDLDKCTDVRVATGKGVKDFTFEIVTADRVYPMYAASKAEMDEWLHTLLSIVGNTTVASPSGAGNDDDEDGEGPASMDEITRFLKSDTKIAKAGYLTKQGGQIKSWKRRWFVLRESTLAYYKDNQSDVPLGLIPLAHCTSIDLVSRKVSKPNAFEVKTPDRVYLLVADTAEILWEWVPLCQAAISKQEYVDNFSLFLFSYFSLFLFFFIFLYFSLFSLFICLFIHFVECLFSLIFCFIFRFSPCRSSRPPL